MNNEFSEEELIRIIQRRRKEIALYDRMLKTPDIKNFEMHVLHVSSWKKSAEISIRYMSKKLMKLREENKTPKYRWAD